MLCFWLNDNLSVLNDIIKSLLKHHGGEINKIYERLDMSCLLECNKIYVLPWPFMRSIKYRAYIIQPPRKWEERWPELCV